MQGGQGLGRSDAAHQPSLGSSPGTSQSLGRAHGQGTSRTTGGERQHQHTAFSHRNPTLATALSLERAGMLCRPSRAPPRPQGEVCRGALRQKSGTRAKKTARQMHDVRSQAMPSCLPAAPSSRSRRPDQEQRRRGNACLRRATPQHQTGSSLMLSPGTSLPRVQVTGRSQLAPAADSPSCPTSGSSCCPSPRAVVDGEQVQPAISTSSFLAAERSPTIHHCACGQCYCSGL